MIGSGIAYLQATAALDGVSAEGDEKTGVQPLRHALEAPIRRIAQNAGVDGPVVVAEVQRRQREGGRATIGYDVVGERYVDMLEAGIIDPVKVAPTAVENAASIGGMILTTEAVVTEKPEEEDKEPTA